jgi:hypothetical protein
MSIESKAPMCLTLEHACEWLGQRGVSLQPLALLEEAARGRIPIFAGIPEGAYSGPVGPSTTQPDELIEMLKLFGHDVAEAKNWRKFSLVEGRRFRKGEMMPVTPDDCLQFLQTGEAHIYGQGGQEWIDAGLPDEWAVEMKVLDIEAFRVKGCDLEAFESVVAKTAATSASTQPAPVSEAVPTRERTVQEAIAQYIADVMAANPGYTADRLHGHMRREAGKPGVPFSIPRPQGDMHFDELGKSFGQATVSAALTSYRKQKKSGVLR